MEKITIEKKNLSPEEQNMFEDIFPGRSSYTLIFFEKYVNPKNNEKLKLQGQKYINVVLDSGELVYSTNQDLFYPHASFCFHIFLIFFSSEKKKEILFSTYKSVVQTFFLSPKESLYFFYNIKKKYNTLWPERQIKKFSCFSKLKIKNIESAIKFLEMKTKISIKNFVEECYPDIPPEKFEMVTSFRKIQYRKNHEKLKDIPSDYFEIQSNSDFIEKNINPYLENLENISKYLFAKELSEKIYPMFYFNYDKDKNTYTWKISCRKPDTTEIDVHNKEAYLLETIGPFPKLPEQEIKSYKSSSVILGIRIQDLSSHEKTKYKMDSLKIEKDYEEWKIKNSL